MDFAYTFADFVVGFIVGMTGVGGGSLMTPILVLSFGIKPSVAVGTDLLYTAITKSGGIFVHQKHRTIEWKIVWLLAAGGVPAVRRVAAEIPGYHGLRLRTAHHLLALA